MSPDPRTWTKDFPFTLKHCRTTLHFRTALAPHTRSALERLVERAPHAKRISAPLDCNRSRLFTKREQLDTFRKQWRVQRGTARRDGLYDWAIEEMINTREAHRRGARVPELLGFGFTRSKIGLIQDLFVITRLFEHHTDALTVLRKDPSNVHRVFLAATELMFSLHSQGITHMDLWAGNVMLCDTQATPPVAIDLENSFFVPTAYTSETLGFQFGFLYLREIYRYITEAEYDRWVDQALAQFAPDVDKAAFNRIYTFAKHEHIGRLDRREIFLKGHVAGC
ncbi:hypothetical protein CCOS865_01709 [Pseudomonas reidholzensis]|uniref:Lipopolysaccharide kinase (Kdo/WaaP) family protein n=1 Tax=Pseudomonas reidholzensis TaxID=1785162 RepID=A0A383RSG4_9PSED|nr:lipopolysaccharide kinase InaA family protein [Pseudomonas reidholzensis]SYX89456.1 hypothetical protein CCOS865_01709 [Pseudomonas reidholzensis]